MTNAFLKGSSRYGGPGPAASPYQRARQVWDDRIGAAVVHARNWRIMAFAGLGLNAALVAAYVAERRGAHAAAYIVPIDEYGRPGRIELLGQPYNPTVAEEGYFIADWIRLIRTRPKDPVVLRENWMRAYDFTAPEAVSQLDSFARSENIFHDIGSSATSVSIVSIIPRSARSFQVNWRETKTDDGVRETKETWTSIVTIALRPPTTETGIRKNPLGLFVTAFQLSKEAA